MSKKKVYIFIIMIVVIIVVFISTGNEDFNFLGTSNSVKTKLKNSVVNGNNNFTNNIGGIGSIDNETTFKLREIIDRLPKNDDSSHVESSLNNYVINKLNAMYSQNGVDIKYYYNETYKSMQCAIYFMERNSIDGYATIKKISSTFDSDPKLVKLREKSEKEMTGSLFLTIPNNEVPQVCAERY